MLRTLVHSLRRWITLFSHNVYFWNRHRRRPPPVECKLASADVTLFLKVLITG